MTQSLPDLTLDPQRADARGSGEPALLYLPGWCGSRRVFDDLLERGARHRRNVAMDLPEHGSRPRSGHDVGLHDVVGDALDLVNTAGIDRFVPVALSHAGWAAIELRRLLGAARVPGVVLVDWMVLGAPPGFTEALAGLQHPTAWRDVRDGLLSMWTSGLGPDHAAVHEYVADMATYDAPYWHRAGREIARSFEAEGSPLAALLRLEASGEACPTLHLYAQPADDGVLGAQQDWASAHPWFEVRRLPGRSHFPMLEAPEETATLIEDFTCRLR